MENMKQIRNIFLVVLVSFFLGAKAFAVTPWINDLRSVFQSNTAVIYALNIRTFNAKDKNQNGIIEENLGEERGTFLNAIDRLDDLVNCGINTIHVLPITPVGKIKAQGTAGSLYAASSFNEINPQFKSPNSKLTIEEEMRKFVEECHNRKIRVIVDVPSCGSYDLYLRRPELFVKDKNQNPVIPSDWADVRLLDAGTDANLNMDVYNLYQEFVDLMISLDVDGIRADVATIKPYTFWKKIIDETRLRNPQFLFLAEASALWTKPPSEYAVFTPYNKLLEAGFDGYYGSYSDLRNWKTASDLISHVQSDVSLSKKYAEPKSVIGSFATHDQISPVLVNGPQFSKMIIWLNATLPLNAYFVDGFSTGDNYIYFWANKKASKTFTDDEYYFVHRGQLDIFNFSRKPGGNQKDIYQDFILANRFKRMSGSILSQGNFVPLRTSASSVFAYARSYSGKSVIVIGNLDFKKKQNVIVHVPKVSNELSSMPIKIYSVPKILKGKISTELAPGEIQVLLFNGLDLK